MTSKMPLLVLATALVILTGCGGGADEPTATGPTGGAPAASSAPAAEDGCGSVAEAVKQHLNRPEVELVSVVGQCTTIVVDTTLADDNKDMAVQLCDAASEVAYTGDINSIRVIAKSGAELSQGIKNLKCLG